MTDNKDDLTRTLTVKRKSNQNSVYKIFKGKGDGNSKKYIIEEIVDDSTKEVVLNDVKINPGDEVGGINGIKSGEVIDESDANDLIESIRIVVVPKDKIDEYDGTAMVVTAEEDSEDDDDYEEYDRGNRTAIVPVNDSKNKTKSEDAKTLVCTHCNRENVDIEPDEDGDYVCEECGYVIVLPGTNKTVHHCNNCGHDNINLEKDDEGDYVCENCGNVIPEDIYTCPDCGKKCVNPVPDEDGDRVCDSCGCILPEKPDADGNDQDDMNSRALVVKEDDPPGVESSENEEEEANIGGGGQQFDEKGRPITNPDGKALTPADMFSPGDVITVTVGKSIAKQDPGLKIEQRPNQKYYIRKVPFGGLFSKTPVIAGDKLLELNGTDIHEYKSLNEMKKVLKEELKITVVVLRKDPDASDSSASSVDYDEIKKMKPIKPRDKSSEDDGDDDDTAPFDGHQCGCDWCPECH